MQVEFECVICGETATATVDKAAASADDVPLKTLQDCPNCGIETIWMES